MKKIKKCPECGANNFTILEYIGWKAHIKKGQVYAKIQNNEIESISCNECKVEFSANFFQNNQINY